MCSELATSQKGQRAPSRKVLFFRCKLLASLRAWGEEHKFLMTRVGFGGIYHRSYYHLRMGTMIRHYY